MVMEIWRYGKTVFGVWRACELAVMRVSQYTVISCKYVRVLWQSLGETK